MYIPLQRVVISLPSTSNPEEIRQTVMIGKPDVGAAEMPHESWSLGFGVSFDITGRH